MSSLSQKNFYLPNRWYGVLETQQLGKKPKAIKRFGIPLVLFRTENGEVGCFVDRCPHRSVELSTGKVVGDLLMCPYHGFTFDRNGTCHEIPCEGSNAYIPTTMKADAFPVTEKYGIIWLWYGAEPEKLGIQKLPDIPWLNDVNLEPGYYSRFSFDWNTSFHRGLEITFDPHHAPIVHGKKSRGVLSNMRKAVNFQWKYENDILELTGRLEEETTDRKPHGYNFRTRLLFPGITAAEIGRYIRMYVVDSPVDEVTTHRIAYWVNDFLRIPILGSLVISLLRLWDFHILQLKEDLPIARTMDRFPDWDVPERLVGADIGIAQLIRIQKLLMSKEQERAEVLPYVIKRQSGWLNRDREKPHGSTPGFLTNMKGDERDWEETVSPTSPTSLSPQPSRAFTSHEKQVDL